MDRAAKLSSLINTNERRKSETAKGDNLGRLSRNGITAFRNEILVSYAAIGVTLIAILAFCVESGARLINLFGKAEWASVPELIVGRSLLGFFMFSGLVFQFTRLGYLRRVSTHCAAPDSELEHIYDSHAPSLAILVPSYKEEPQVVRQTLLAAALQQSPNRRIVLLIDDPPTPSNRDDAAKLAVTRNLPHEINTLFAAPSRQFEQALVDFIQRQKNGLFSPRQEVQRLAALLREAADWLDRLAHDTAMNNHTDALFVERILRAPARSHRSRAFALRTRPDPASVDLLLEYRRLATLFKIEVTSFERKRYVNLSHESNKAMNLNSYIALMGKQFREVEAPDGCVLEQTNGE